MNLQDAHWPLSCFASTNYRIVIKKYLISAFHLERRESKPKAWVRMNDDIEMNPKIQIDSHPSTNEA